MTTICIAGATGWTGRAPSTGTLLAARAVAGRSGLTRGLDTLLIEG